jgi:hypothetical protein
MSYIPEHSFRITQASTSAPTALDIVNELPNEVTVAYAYSGVGVYTATYTGFARFGLSASDVVIPPTWQAGNATHNQKATFAVSVTTTTIVVTISTFEAPVANPNTFVAANAVLSALPVTIRFVAG